MLRAESGHHEHHRGRDSCRVDVSGASDQHLHEVADAGRADRFHTDVDDADTSFLLPALVRLGASERVEQAFAEMDEQELATGQMRIALAALCLARGDPEAATVALAPVLDGSAAMKPSAAQFSESERSSMMLGSVKTLPPRC